MAQMAYLQDPASASRKMVGELVASGRIPVIQYSGAAQVHDLAAVNALAAEFGTNVQIRFFGREWQAFDASLLDQLPDVANLSLDTLRTITNLGSLAGLSQLVELRFAVFEHPDGGFLKTLPLDRYTSLGIGENK